MTRAEAQAEARRRWWGCADVDGEGVLRVLAVRRTRREAVAACGFATEYNRERSGAFYIYTSVEGYQVYVGRVRDLLEEGYAPPTDAAFADADRRNP